MHLREQNDLFLKENKNYNQNNRKFLVSSRYFIFPLLNDILTCYRIMILGKHNTNRGKLLDNSIYCSVVKINLLFNKLEYGKMLDNNYAV